MYLYLYNLITASYYKLIRIAAWLGNTKAKQWYNGRKNLWQQIAENIHSSKPKVWFHCASLGEFEQARPVIEKFRQLYSNYQIVLTFFSPSGYEVRKNYNQADLVCYLPPDNKTNAERFLEIICPQIIFWTKYDFWYYYLQTAKQKKIPVILFSAIFRKEQIFFKPYGVLHRKMLLYFSHIFVQNESSYQLLKKLHISSVDVAGDTRFDRVVQILQEPSPNVLCKVAQFKNNTPLLIAGSVWQEDLQIIEAFLEKFSKPLKLILVPHEIHEFQIKSLQKKHQAILFTELEQTQHLEKYQVLVVNAVGFLSKLYSYANFAFVGGGYKQGLHNILEPAVFGLPIFFGNKAYHKFQEAHDLLKLQTAWKIANAQQLTNILEKIYTDTEFQEKCRQVTQDYVKRNTGATQKILQAAHRWLLSQPNSLSYP